MVGGMMENINLSTMNQDFKLLVALDIGTTKVAATAARKYSNGHIEVLGVERTTSTAVKRGIIMNIEETVSCIKKVVDALETRLAIRISEVFAGISGYNMKSVTNSCYRFIEKDTEITSFDIEQLRLDSFRIALEPGEKILHVIPQEYTVDNDLVEGKPIGMYGRRLEGKFNVIIGNVNVIKNIEKCIERAGCNMAGLIHEPLASAYGVLSDEEMEAGAVVVDIGGGTTDIALFYDGILRYTAVIPLGGNVITSDIKEGCSVIQKQAEALKVQFGSALESSIEQDMVVAIPGMPGWEPKEISFKSLACIIQARMEEIIEFTLRHIELSGFYDKLGAGIVVTGGGALLKHIAPLFKLKTGLDVKLGTPDRWLSLETASEKERMFYTTAMGLLTSSSIFAPRRAVEQKLFDTSEHEVPIQERSKKKPQSSPRPKSIKESNYRTGDLFDSIRNKLAGIFDPDDVEM